MKNIKSMFEDEELNPRLFDAPSDEELEAFELRRSWPAGLIARIEAEMARDERELAAVRRHAENMHDVFSPRKDMVFGTDIGGSDTAVSNELITPVLIGGVELQCGRTERGYLFFLVSDEGCSSPSLRYIEQDLRTPHMERPAAVMVCAVAMANDTDPDTMAPGEEAFLARAARYCEAHPEINVVPYFIDPGSRFLSFRTCAAQLAARHAVLGQNQMIVIALHAERSGDLYEGISPACSYYWTDGISTDTYSMTVTHSPVCEASRLSARIATAQAQIAALRAGQFGYDDLHADDAKYYGQNTWFDDEGAFDGFDDFMFAGTTHEQKELPVVRSAYDRESYESWAWMPVNCPDYNGRAYLAMAAVVRGAREELRRFFSDCIEA